MSVSAAPSPRVPETKEGIARHSGTVDNHDADKTKQNKNTSDADAIKASLAEIIRLQNAQAQKLAADADQKAQEVQINRNLAEYTNRLVWVGVLQAIVLLLSVGAIWLQTRLTFKLERPWVLVTTKKPDNFTQMRDFVAVVKNYGKTPARITETWSGQTTEPLPEKPVYGKHGIREVLLPPGEPIYPFTRVVSKEDARIVHDGKKHLHIYGYINYRDIRGCSHYTRFCYSYRIPEGSSEMQGSFWLDGPDAYNETT